MKRIAAALFPLVSRSSHPCLRGMLVWMLITHAATIGLSDEKRLTIQSSDATITIWQGRQPMLVYNKVSPPVPPGIDPVYQRSGFLHPVYTPRGTCVTAAFPADHPHQHGIFAAWTKTTYDGRRVDFWNLAKGEGRVVHHRVIEIIDQPDHVGFEVELLHRIVGPPQIDVLRSRWRLTAREGDESIHMFELSIDQRAITDKPLIVQQYHYGGLAARGPAAWVEPGDADVKRDADARRDADTKLDRDSKPDADATKPRCAMVNDHNENRITGNGKPARWVAMWSTHRNPPASLLIESHRDNPGFPQPARLHPSKPYFCFAPCIAGSFVIDQRHPYQARYRFYVSDTLPNPPPRSAWVLLQN